MQKMNMKSQNKKIKESNELNNNRNLITLDDASAVEIIPEMVTHYIGLVRYESSSWYNTGVLHISKEEATRLLIKFKGYAHYKLIKVKLPR